MLFYFVNYLNFHISPKQRNNKTMICTAYIQFEGHITIVYCKYSEDIEDIINKFCSKTDQNPNTITFNYSGKNLNRYPTLDEIILPLDRNLNEIKILAINNDLNK